MVAVIVVAALAVLALVTQAGVLAAAARPSRAGPDDRGRGRDASTSSISARAMPPVRRS